MKELLSAKTENNPQRITLTDSPLPSFNYSGADEMMSYARASSSKPDKKPKKKTVNGGNLATVQSERAADLTVPNFVDASVSGVDLVQQREIVPLGNIEKNTQKFISQNKDCGDFISDLLKKASEITGVPSVPNPFSGNLIDFSPQKYTNKDGQTEILEAQAFGRFYALPDSNGARQSYGALGITPITKEWVYPQYEYIIKYIHESIHNAATSAGFGGGANDATAYTDRILAIASFDVINGRAENDRLKASKENYQRILTDRRYQNTSSYSRFWNSLLRYYCPNK